MDRVGAPERRVVIVDDSRTIQAILDNAFGARRGFKVVGMAGDAQSAAELITRVKPDIVTIDLNMPYIDGAALLAMIAHVPGVCKVVVSDQATKSIVMTNRLEAAGASVCLGKRELVDDADAFFDKVDAAWARLRSDRRRSGRVDLPPPTATMPIPVTAVGSGVAYPVPDDEARRLRALRSKRLANAVHERQFDLVTRHLAGLAEFPMCLMTFIDATTQWIKASYGLDAPSTPRAHAFCNYTISQSEPFIVGNALKDERFASNPLVTGSPHIRTYAGHPITTPDGVRLGALCLIDVRPRNVGPSVLKQMADMADLLGEMIDQKAPLVI